PRQTFPRWSAASNEGAREARGVGGAAVGPEAPARGARRLPTRLAPVLLACLQSRTGYLAGLAAGAGASAGAGAAAGAAAAAAFWAWTMFWTSMSLSMTSLTLV